LEIHNGRQTTQQSGVRVEPRGKDPELKPSKNAKGTEGEPDQA
jgi:hypothetical protein